MKMKLHTVYDQFGQIMAAVQLNQPLLLEQYMDVPLPMAQEGHQVAEIDLPEEFGHLSLYELCTQLKVDTKAECPTFIFAERQCEG
jgi:hypothetical protein